MSSVSQNRIEVLNECGIASEGEYVLYWMVAARRSHFNPSLQRAIEWAEKLGS